MNIGGRTATPWHLWVVGILSLLWNAVGIASYMMTRLDKLESLGMSAEQIAYFDTIPVWANATWALGVWGAFFGSLLLLLRSRWAVPSLIVSVVGLVGTTIYERAFADIPAELNNPLLSIVIWITTLALLWYAMRMQKAGVLR